VSLISLSNLNPPLTIVYPIPNAKDDTKIAGEFISVETAHKTKHNINTIDLSIIYHSNPSSFLFSVSVFLGSTGLAAGADLVAEAAFAGAERFITIVLSAACCC